MLAVIVLMAVGFALKSSEPGEIAAVNVLMDTTSVTLLGYQRQKRNSASCSISLWASSGHALKLGKWCVSG